MAIPKSYVDGTTRKGFVYSNYNDGKAKYPLKLTLQDSETGDLYDISVKNGKLICLAQDEVVRRENRLKNLLDE